MTAQIHMLIPAPDFDEAWALYRPICGIGKADAKQRYEAITSKNGLTIKGKTIHATVGQIIEGIKGYIADRDKKAAAGDFIATPKHFEFWLTAQRWQDHEGYAAQQQNIERDNRIATFQIERTDRRRRLAELRQNIDWYHGQAVKIPGSDWTSLIVKAEAEITKLEKG